MREGKTGLFANTFQVTSLDIVPQISFMSTGHDKWFSAWCLYSVSNKDQDNCVLTLNYIVVHWMGGNEGESIFISTLRIFGKPST